MSLLLLLRAGALLDVEELELVFHLCGGLFLLLLLHHLLLVLNALLFDYLCYLIVFQLVVIHVHDLY